MADYAIGDIQGCFEPLQRLLDKLHFDEKVDRLWFVGDLVNRGPQSLEVLRFIKNLPLKPRIVLGNHDLHLLALLYITGRPTFEDDTLHAILKANDKEELGDWLRKQSILYHDQSLNMVICHAGISPMWDLDQATMLARELEDVLSGDHFEDFLRQMYGNEPDHWSEDLCKMDRLRVICNYFTRMRFCDERGHLKWGYKGPLAGSPSGFYPWYMVPHQKKITADIVFGHWAALEGKCPLPNRYAIDTGCFWGGELTALRLQDKQRFRVPGLRSSR